MYTAKTVLCFFLVATITGTYGSPIKDEASSSTVITVVPITNTSSSALTVVPITNTSKTPVTVIPIISTTNTPITVVPITSTLPTVQTFSTTLPSVQTFSTSMPTVNPYPSPAPSHGFDGASFGGGFALGVGVCIIMLVGFICYSRKRSSGYNTM
ncbi:hepatitis A virus cellular receptor 1-like isoform X2 [Mya arenaria]|uniref:hepatitis A virus cellular receptor 1-like isoform X2 n=1 Tax=Mya arenaria TaxID=6604 RepID=UPI0022E73A9D|nr:hepatitis A virus cellular receptor 1-like isoform X2 [Mya arenaria]